MFDWDVVLVSSVYAKMEPQSGIHKIVSFARFAREVAQEIIISLAFLKLIFKKYRISGL